MKHNQIRYTPVQVLSISNQMQLTSLVDFISYIENYSINQIYCIVDIKNSQPKNFAFMHNNILLRHSSMGFATLEDYSKAETNQFPDAETFYKAQKEGYKLYKDYAVAMQAGISEKATLDTIKQNGFVKGFEEFAEQITQYPANVQEACSTIKDAYKLYQYAIDNGFDTYANLQAAISKGFTNKALQDVATELEFLDNDSYENALQRGFRTYSELLDANNAKVRDVNDMFKYMELKNVGEPTNTFDERLLMVILSKIEQGKRLSINKLYDYFLKTIAQYQYDDTNELPQWFSQQFNDKDVFTQYISTSTQLKKYGHYDYDGEFFQLNKMQDRMVVLDGSNVAHNSNGQPNSIPSIANLIIMAKFLKQQGFTEIAIIVDASLKKKIHDIEKIKILTEMAEYLVAPPENSADMFIIEYVKSKHCLLISNDTFREWKTKDLWVAENIDYYRLAFMIKDNEVLMPDLK
jgi:hypothetical protein